MNSFSVTSSILSAQELGRLISNRYSLTDNTCQLIKTFVNDTYLVTQESVKYIFRVYSFGWRSEIEVAEEIRLIDLLRHHHIKVSYAIADEDGRYIQKLEAPEGIRFGVLFSFAVGDKSFNPPAEVNFKIGEMMAKIHLKTIQMKLERVNYDSQILLIDSFEKFKSYLPKESDEMNFMVATQKFLANEFANADLSKIRQGAVHFDIWADNLHVDNHNNITLFDFDFCGNGWLCYDIAFYLLMLFTSEGNEIEYRKRVESFMNGYESIIKMNAEEKRLLPAIAVSLCYFYLGVQRERFATIFFNEEHLKRYVNFRIKKWMTFHSLNR